MNTDFNLERDSYVAMGGGPVEDAYKSLAKSVVGDHPNVVFGVLLALSGLLVLFLIMMLWRKKEGFNPTTTLRLQQRDGLGERMTTPDRSQSAFAQQVQTSAGIPTFVADPSAAPGAPGSLSYQILASPDLACSTRQPASTDAWSWMTGVATEQMSGRPKTDSDFSRVLAGQ